MYSCIFYATLRHKRCTAISTCTTSCSTKETRLSEKSSSFICSSSNFNIFTLFIIMAWPKEHRTHRKKGKRMREKKQRQHKRMKENPRRRLRWIGKTKKNWCKPCLSNLLNFIVIKVTASNQPPTITTMAKKRVCFEFGTCSSRLTPFHT